MCRIISFSLPSIFVRCCCLLLFQTCPFFHLRRAKWEEKKIPTIKLYDIVAECVRTRDRIHNNTIQKNMFYASKFIHRKFRLLFRLRFGSSFHIICHYSCVYFCSFFGRFSKMRGALARSHIYKWNYKSLHRLSTYQNAYTHTLTYCIVSLKESERNKKWDVRVQFNGIYNKKTNHKHLPNSMLAIMCLCLGVRVFELAVWMDRIHFSFFISCSMFGFDTNSIAHCVCLSVFFSYLWFPKRKQKWHLRLFLCLSDISYVFQLLLNK